MEIVLIPKIILILENNKTCLWQWNIILSLSIILKHFFLTNLWFLQIEIIIVKLFLFGFFGYCGTAFLRHIFELRKRLTAWKVKSHFSHSKWICDFMPQLNILQHAYERVDLAPSIMRLSSYYSSCFCLSTFFFIAGQKTKKTYHTYPHIK
jgi:hypothetical protein